MSVLRLKFLPALENEIGFYMETRYDFQKFYC